ncbi:hypothetical protein [Streptomyces sp. HUAS ZL42]|uniref:hypothetical protein n=1 Tax=Streptomyces sp. HUAS ZL42 TaxID=3231715 RepID=UPI00345E6F0D
MAKTTTARGRTSVTGTRRTMTAAARAAAKRAERAERGLSEDPQAGRTVIIDPEDEKGWDDPPEPSRESLEEEPSGTLQGRRRLLTASLCVLLVAGLVAAGVLGWRYREGMRAEQARGQAVAAARQAAPIVLSYDYRHLNRDFAAAQTRLTGHFRDEYRKTTTTVVGPTATKYHGVVKATVADPTGGTPAASVISSSPDRAVVLLFVNQVTTSTQVSGSRVDLNRVRMTLTRTEDGWKVSGVDAL